MLRRLRIFLAALALAVVPALAVLSTAGGADAAVTGPAAPLLGPSAYSIPYSGYVANGPATYTSATAGWSQPAGSCTSQNSGARFYIGLGGWNNSPSAAAGTDTDCSGGSPVYYAWYKTSTSGFVTYGNAIQAGDNMVATITCTGGTTCTLDLADATANWGASVTVTLSGPPQSAEAFVGTNGLLPLTNFGTVNFATVQFNTQSGVLDSVSSYLITDLTGQTLNSLSPMSSVTLPIVGTTWLFFSATWLSATWLSAT